MYYFNVAGGMALCGWSPIPHRGGVVKSPVSPSLEVLWQTGAAEKAQLELFCNQLFMITHERMDVDKDLRPLIHTCMASIIMYLRTTIGSEGEKHEINFSVLKCANEQKPRIGRETLLKWSDIIHEKWVVDNAPVIDNTEAAIAVLAKEMGQCIQTYRTENEKLHKEVQYLKGVLDKVSRELQMLPGALKDIVRTPTDDSFSSPKRKQPRAEITPEEHQGGQNSDGVQLCDRGIYNTVTSIKGLQLVDGFRLYHTSGLPFDRWFQGKKEEKSVVKNVMDILDSYLSDEDKSYLHCQDNRQEMQWPTKCINIVQGVVDRFLKDLASIEAEKGGNGKGKPIFGGIYERLKSMRIANSAAFRDQMKPGNPPSIRPFLGPLVRSLSSCSVRTGPIEALQPSTSSG
jgi:hypothetical protein